MKNQIIQMDIIMEFQKNGMKMERLRALKIMNTTNLQEIINIGMKMEKK